MEISTIPAAFVLDLLQGAETKGYNAHELVKRVDISPELIMEKRARIPAQKFSQLYELLRNELEDEYCGLLEEPVKPGTFAMLCYGCIHCPTLGQFLIRGCEFRALTTDSFGTEVTTQGEMAHYVFTPMAGTINSSDVLTISVLSIIHRLASWLIGQKIILESVNLNLPRPKHAADYSLLFRAPIHFDNNESSIVFSNSYLSMPVIQNEQSLDKFLKSPGGSLMASPDLGNSFAAKVNQFIRTSTGADYPGFDSVAKKMNTSTGTLRRRLKTEGTSYQQLKDELRRDTAIYNLSKGRMSIEEVAESVGFLEPTSFFRAFKRWTGVTPRAYIAKN